MGTLSLFSRGGVSVFGNKFAFSILPQADNTYDLGSVALSWKDAHFETAVYATSVIGNWSPSATGTYTLGTSSLGWLKAYFDATSGTDADIDIINLLVTGTPKFWWDESDDRFALTKGLNIGSDGSSVGDFFVYGEASGSYMQYDESANNCGRLNVFNSSIRTTMLRSLNECGVAFRTRQDEDTGAGDNSTRAVLVELTLDATKTNASAANYAELSGISSGVIVSGILDGSALCVAGLKGEIRGGGTQNEVKNIAAVSAKYNNAENPLAGDSCLYWGWSHAGIVDYGLLLEAGDSGSITTGIKIPSATTGIDFTGTYTGNPIDLSGVTQAAGDISLIRAGSYASPMDVAGEAEYSMFRVYLSTDDDGANYNRGVFACLKTSGTKSINPIAGLAEVLAQGGNGPGSVSAGQFIAHMNSATAKVATRAFAGWANFYGLWAKVTSEVGSIASSGSVVTPIWLDNQMNGTVNGEEYACYITSGTAPDAVFGFEITAGGGWGQLFYFDDTCYNQSPISNTSLKVKLHTTQYYLPLSTTDTTISFGKSMTMADTTAINTGVVNDDYYTLGAVNNGDNLIDEVARIYGATLPRFQFTLPPNMGAVATVTLDTDGDFTITSPYMKIQPYGGEGAANDSLVNLEGAKEGDVVIIRAATSTTDSVDQITITDTGNIKLAGNADFVLDDVLDVWMGIFDGTQWLELGRNANTA